MTEIIWVVFIVIAAAVCAVVIGKKETKQNFEKIEERAILFAEECYIEGIIPIQKVKRMAEFYMVEESNRSIQWDEAVKRVEESLNQCIEKQER